MSAEQELHELLKTFDPMSAPIGLYVVTPGGELVKCNAYARHLLRLPADGSLTKKIGDFYADPAERSKVLDRVLQAEAAGNYLEKTIIHFKIDQQDVYVQNNCRSLRHPQTNELIGFMGSLVDITDEHQYSILNQALQKRIEELTFDIGRVFHANTSTLVMVHQALTNASHALGPNPFDHNQLPSIDEIDQALTQPAQETATVLEKLLQFSQDAQRTEALPPAYWKELEESLPLLRSFINEVPIQETRASTLRSVACRIQEICGKVQAKTLPRELLRELLRTTSNLERIAALVSILNTRVAVIQMDYTIRSLRDFITSDIRQVEKHQRLKVATLIDAAIRQLADFAQFSRVRVVPKNEIGEAAVMGNERDLVRAFANLLHNGIKYTWHRNRVESPWVTVRMWKLDNSLCITFENWGVPIGKDELESNLIFQLGYRGKWSKDRGRLGTGIGLTDAREVALKHHGHIAVESRPARTNTSISPDSEAYMKQPFITTVTMFLPETENDE